MQRETERAARRAIRAAKAAGLDRQAQQGAAEQARSFAAAELIQRVQVQTGFDTVPALNNPRFVLQLVFAPAIGAEEPKPRFAYVFPGKNEGLIQARLRADLSASERRHAIDMLREAVASPAFSLKSASYVVTGDPVVRDGVAAGLSHQAAVLLVVAALLVAVALALAFGGPFPLLPLLLALAVAALAFGSARLAGASLTLATVALLPVLIALAAAFAALLQARATRTEAARLVTAGLVTAAGLVALLGSPAPMMRSFGAIAIAGVVLAFAVTGTAGVAAQALLNGCRPAGSGWGAHDGSIASAAPCSARRSGARGGPSGSRSQSPCSDGWRVRGSRSCRISRGSRPRISRRFETPPSCGTRRGRRGR